MRIPNIKWVLLLLGIFVIIGVSCSPCIEGYKRRTADDGRVRFSFEYPCNWEVGVIKSQFGGRDTFYVEAPSLERGNLQIVSTFWYFEVFPAVPIGNKQNAKVALDDEIQSEEDRPDFKILERSEVEISEVTAEKAVITFTYQPSDFRVRSFLKEFEFMVERHIYFDHKGLIWHIEEQSNIEVAEANKFHFEHMIQTFKIH